MKIRNLKIANCLGIKSIDLNIAENEKIIGVICKKKAGFEKSDFSYVMEQVFGGGFDLRSGEIECVCEKKEKLFYLNLTALKREDSKVVFEKELSGKTIKRNVTCLCEDSVDGKIKWICGLDYKQWLYPSPFSDYGFYRGETMLDQLICGVEDESLFQTVLDSDKQELISSLNKRLTELPVVYLSNKSIGVDSDGRLGVADGVLFNPELEKALSKNEILLARFMGWTFTLNLLDNICKDTGRSLGFPVFVDGIFDKLKKENYNLFFNCLRKTERQAFVVLDDYNEEISSYFDKIVKAETI